MCLVIDTCSFHSVFNPQNKKHGHFEAVRRWIFEGKGKLIYGGTTFTKEMNGHRALGLLKELSKIRKLVHIPNAKVDAMERLIKKKEPAKAFNDPHLVALVALSKCCVICTDEKEAIPYLKRADLYPKNVKPPRIYRNNSHAKLCCKDHVVKVCQ